MLSIGKVEYESERIYFTQPAVNRYYLPDWTISKGNYIEAKGRLTTQDRKKLIWVKEQNPDINIYIIFGNANNKLTKRSKVTYRDWAEKNGFECIDVSEEIPKKWFAKLKSLSKKGEKLNEST